MKVVTQQVEITEVPGYERIVIEVDPHSARGVQIVMIEDTVRGISRSFGLTEAADLARCVEQAAQIGDQIAEQMEAGAP